MVVGESTRTGLQVGSLAQVPLLWQLTGKVGLLGDTSPNPSRSLVTSLISSLVSSLLSAQKSRVGLMSLSQV
jgi:hypothetical protein